MVKRRVTEFLKKYGMDHESIDMESHCRIFMEEMKRGLEGKESTLQMIPTYISVDREVPVNERAVVIDAGGTNFRVAAVHFDRDRKPVVEDFKLYPMPGTQGEISADEFFRTMGRYVAPVLEKSDRIGFCFSYPVEILPSKDGRLISFSKEVKVKGAEGLLLGENLLAALKESGFSGDKRIVLLNDTVATLLGGKATFPDRIFGSYIGFILGTGTNTCYIEANRNIAKAEAIQETKGSMLINIESGDYGKAPRGRIDLEFDIGTVNPGRYTFEKMISGAYQGGLMLAVVKKAAEEGLFSEQALREFKKLEGLSSKAIDDFLYHPYGRNVLAVCCGVAAEQRGTEDRLTMYFLIDEMMERAAKLVAVNLSAVILKTGLGVNPCAPVCVAAEGTTFYKSKLFRAKLDYYVREYMNRQKGVYCEFVKAENATLIGTAIAGLLN